jgi:hypothetical protein
VADVADRASGSGDALEVSLVGAVEREAEGDFVVCGEEVVDFCVEVRETRA